MSRKAKWIVFGIGVPVLLLGGLWLVLALSTSSGQPTPQVAQRDIPDAWVSPEVNDVQDPTPLHDEKAPPADPLPANPDAPSSPVPEVATVQEPYELSGSLAFLGGERSFGSEAYSLTVDESGVRLVSSGEFSFKVALVTVRVPFEQTLVLDADQRPIRYLFDLNAPLGFDEYVEAEFETDEVLITSDEGDMRLPLPSTPVFAMGSFSTYALLPLLFADDSQLVSASFDVIAFGGPPGDEEETDEWPRMDVVREGTSILRSANLDVEVAKYRVSSDDLAGFLYARGREFLAFYAGDEEGSLLIYRTDFFPDGVEIVN